MTKLLHTKPQTIEDMLASGLVIFEYDLMTLSFIGRDQNGAKYSVSESDFIANEMNKNLVTYGGKVYYRCKPRELKCSTVTPLRNISDNRV